METNEGNCFEYGRCERQDCIVCSASGIDQATEGQPKPNKMSFENIRHEFAPTAFKLCQCYLGGAWKTILFKNFIFETVSGGLSNYLYSCKLPTDVKPVGKEPNQVLIRLYGQVIDINARIYEGVVFSLLSERGFGPHLYGIFPNGRIEQYIPSRHLTVEELGDTKLSSSIAMQLAKYHSMVFPLNNEPMFLWDRIEQMLSTIDNVEINKKEDAEISNQINEMFSLRDESLKLKNYLQNEESKVVFCHNDVQEGNVLLLNDTEDSKIQLIDYEYSSYNYREFDIGNHFCEFMYRYNTPTTTGFELTTGGYPTHEQQVHFVRSYLKSCVALSYLDDGDGSDDDAVERLVEQSNKFALASHFYWGIWALLQNISTCIEFGYMEYGLRRLKDYNSMKKKLNLPF